MRDVVAMHRTNWLNAVTAYATIAIVLFVVLRFTPTWDLLTTPTGSDIPSTAPLEENRVYHPFGFSMIAPQHWRTRVQAGDDGSSSSPAGLAMSPGGAIPRRYGASMGVAMITRPNKLDEYTPVAFQGKPAFQRVSSWPDRGFESPGCLIYDLALERENRWYIIHFRVFTDKTQLPPEIMPYIESFRIHHSPTVPREPNE